MGDAPKVQHISPPSTFSKLKKEVKAMSPIDTTLWNDMENYSPRTQNWLDSEIPLYRLDLIMGMDPFAHSLKNYDPTGSIAPPSSKELKCEDSKGAIVPMECVSPEEIKKNNNNLCDPHPHFPTKNSDVDFG